MTFTKGPGASTDSFGRSEFLRSTRDVKTRSATIATASIPDETINGFEGRKFLQRGEVIAKITSGPHAGKYGPFQAGATDGRQTAANIVGFLDTFVPWRANANPTVNVAVVYEAAVVQAWCTERDAAGERVALTNTTRDAMGSTTSTSFLFH